MENSKSQFTNVIQSTGVKIAEATPVDDRLQVLTEDVLKTLFNTPLTSNAVNYITTLYDGMVILVKDVRKEYIWTESMYGLLATSYTYPSYANNIAGQNYASKKYNFVLFDKVAKVSITYSNTSEAGLFIPTALLPLNVIKDMNSATVIMKSSDSQFNEMELPDRITVASTGITIILDPKPALNEQFKLTIY